MITTTNHFSIFADEARVLVQVLAPRCPVLDLDQVEPGPIEAELMQALTGQEWTPEAMDQFHLCAGGGEA